MRTHELRKGMMVYVTPHDRLGTIDAIDERDGQTWVWVQYDINEFDWWQAYFVGDPESESYAKVRPEDVVTLAELRERDG